MKQTSPPWGAQDLESRKRAPLYNKKQEEETAAALAAAAEAKAAAAEARAALKAAEVGRASRTSRPLQQARWDLPYLICPIGLLRLDQLTPI